MHLKGRRHRLMYKKKVDPSLIVETKGWPASQRKTKTGVAWMDRKKDRYIITLPMLNYFYPILFIFWCIERDFGNRMALRNTVVPSWMMVSSLVHNLLVPIGRIMLVILD